MTASRARDRATFGVTPGENSVVTKWVPYPAILEKNRLDAIRTAVQPLAIQVPRSSINKQNHNELVLEDIGDHWSLLEQIRDEPFSIATTEAVRTCGRALAAIHQHSAHEAEAPLVVAHGDFSTQNVLLTHPETEGAPGGGLSIWLIDPAPNYYSSFDVGELQDRRLDVATFTLRTLWPFRVSTYSSLVSLLRLRVSFLASYNDYSQRSAVTSWTLLQFELRLLVRYLLNRRILRLQNKERQK